jgi:hypothetical protein
MPLQQTSGNLSSDAYGGGAAYVPTYIEDVFSTWLYAGNGNNQTIVNNINLAGKGGLVWQKARVSLSSVLDSHFFSDSARGSANVLSSNNTDAQNVAIGAIGGAFNNNGFNSIAYGSGYTGLASWTFRKQPKFFDVVTYTGNGGTQNIPHNLGSVPGCIIVKRTDSAGDWSVWHKDASTLYLNSTAAVGFNIFGSVTSTTFGVTPISYLNASGGSFVAYIFAHNAGGFGLTGTDNVISCGSFTTDASGATSLVNLGYEPQWILYKSTSDTASTTGAWQIVDSMRGLYSGPTVPNEGVLFPNNSNSESAWPVISVSPTGFQTTNQGYLVGNSTFIYIAIRRGPMKVPTDATKVFTPVARTTTGAVYTYSGNSFPVDLVLQRQRVIYNTVRQANAFDRLRGALNELSTAQTTAEEPRSGITTFASMNGYTADYASVTEMNYISGNDEVYWNFRRAPGFFDEVCYSGDGTSALALTHNLQAVPQLIIVKDRSNAKRWQVYSATIGASAYLILNTTAASTVSSSMWNATTPTSTTFTVGDIGDNNVSANTYVAYLFATCPGVSKVGSYTGTGTTQTISCGFTGGARFVLVKRTDSTGDWYVWDTARGMVSGTDPSLLLNSTAAEVNANSIYTTTGGFQIVSTAAGINASGGAYIFLAIA